MTLEDFLAEWKNKSSKLLVHTSGSTGKPKPIWVEKQKMLNSAHITCDFLGLKPGDTTLLCMPLDYIAGKMVVVRSLERGMKLISVKPNGHPLASLSEPPTFAAMVPLQVYNSLKVEKERNLLRQIRHLIIGGGAIDDQLAKELKDFPNHVWSTYGMTETLSHIALRQINGNEASDWYTPFDNVKISQAADGCLIINAPHVHDGTLSTNDRVETRINPNTGKKQFRVLGRKDNVIDSGGIKIQIEEVETILIPFLKDRFAITKATDEKFGEIVVLATESHDMANVAETCANVLPKYWIPKEYRHVDKIPMTETGKIRRAILAQEQGNG